MMSQSPPEPDLERLRRALLDNGESAEEAESLAQLARFLRHLPAVAAPPALALRVQQRMGPVAPPLSRWDRLREWPPLVLLLSQRRVIQRDIWIASALVLLLGTLVTLSVPSGPGVIPLAVIAPIVAAVGVALLYDDDVARMLELEGSTPTSPRLILLARLTLVFGFDLMLALGGSIVLALVRADISLMPLVLSWLAPMTFLSGLAFFLSVMLRETAAAYGLSLLLWMMHLLFRTNAIDGFLQAWLSLPGLSAPENRIVLFVSAVVCVTAALWWAGQDEKRMSYDATY